MILRMLQLVLPIFAAAVVAIACDYETKIVPPPSRALVIVEPDRQEAFFQALEEFADNHQFKYEKQYLPFKTRPYTEIVLSREDGDRISIDNHHEDREFNVSFFVFNPSTDLVKLKADFVSVITLVVGPDNVK